MGFKGINIIYACFCDDTARIMFSHCGCLPSVPAGQYGGGAGSRTGGSGGGGGYSRLSFNLSPREVVDIEVGKAGTPSYGEAGSGIVVVTWGGLRIDDFVEEFDVTKECVISTIKKKELID